LRVVVEPECGKLKDPHQEDDDMRTAGLP
jgi:hypothetical protein